MKRFREIAFGILCGGEPSIADIDVLKNIWGVKRIISLDKGAGKRIDRQCNDLDIEHLILPIFDKTESEAALEFFVNNVCHLLTDNQPVYFHCVHGRDRTGFLLALYRIKCQGWSARKALDEGKMNGFGNGFNPVMLQRFMDVIYKVAGKKEDINETSDFSTSNFSSVLPLGPHPDAPSIARDSYDPGSAVGGGGGTGFNYFSPIPPVQDEVMGIPNTQNTVMQPNRKSQSDFAATDDSESKSRKRKLRKEYLSSLKDRNDAMGYVGVRDDIAPNQKATPQVGRNVSSDGAGNLSTLPFGSYFL